MLGAILFLVGWLVTSFAVLAVNQKHLQIVTKCLQTLLNIHLLAKLSLVVYHCYNLNSIRYERFTINNVETNIYLNDIISYSSEKNQIPFVWQ